jgi:hypothetical protein
MATVTALKTKAATTQRGKQRAQVSEMQTFTWVGIDKRGAKIKGEQISPRTPTAWSRPTCASTASRRTVVKP